LALASNVEGRRQIIEANGVRVIVHHAQEPGALAGINDAPETASVVEHCICLLSTLTWNDDSVISQLVACGGLELLVARLL
jgi:type II secretory pathway component HofQ